MTLFNMIPMTMEMAKTNPIKDITAAEVNGFLAMYIFISESNTLLNSLLFSVEKLSALNLPVAMATIIKIGPTSIKPGSAN